MIVNMALMELETEFVGFGGGCVKLQCAMNNHASASNVQEYLPSNGQAVSTQCLPHSSGRGAWHTSLNVS